MLERISLSEIQEQPTAVFERLKRNRAPVAITEDDKTTAVLIPADRYEALMAQLRDYRDYLDVFEAQQGPAESLESVLEGLGFSRPSCFASS